MIKKVISPIQLFWFYVQTQIGVGLLTIPNDVNLGDKSDGWISIILAGLLGNAIILMYWFIHRCNPNISYFEVLSSVFGAVLGRIISCLYAIYFILAAGSILLSFSNLLMRWSLGDTPRIIIIILLLVVSIYGACSSIATIANIMVLLSPMFLISAFCTLNGYLNGNPLKLLPILKTDYSSLFEGMYLTILALDGFIILLILFPYVNAPQKTKLLTAIYGNTFVIALYTLITIATYTYFGSGLLDLLKEPFLFMIRTVSIDVIESIDLLFVSFWSNIIIASIIVYLFMTYEGISNVFKNVSRLGLFILVGLIITVLTEIPYNMFLISQISDYIEKLGIVFLFIIPSVIALSSLVGLTKAKEES